MDAACASRERNPANRQPPKALVENARLPDASLFSTLRQYLQEKQISAKWELERVEDALYHVTVSWYAPTLTVYAFEANVQAQTVRGLNTAAVKLLSEGFPSAADRQAQSRAATQEVSRGELFSSDGQPPGGA